MWVCWCLWAISPNSENRWTCQTICSASFGWICHEVKRSSQTIGLSDLEVLQLEEGCVPGFGFSLETLVPTPCHLEWHRDARRLGTSLSCLSRVCCIWPLLVKFNRSTTYRGGQCRCTGKGEFRYVCIDHGLNIESREVARSHRQVYLTFHPRCHCRSTLCGIDFVPA